MTLSCARSPRTANETTRGSAGGDGTSGRSRDPSNKASTEKRRPSGKNAVHSKTAPSAMEPLFSTNKMRL